MFLSYDHFHGPQLEFVHLLYWEAQDWWWDWLILVCINSGSIISLCLLARLFLRDCWSLFHGYSADSQSVSCPQGSPGPSLQSCFHLFPSLCWGIGFFLPKFKTWNFPFLNLVRFLLARFSRLLRSLGMAAHLSGVVATPPHELHLQTCCSCALSHLPVHQWRGYMVLAPGGSRGYLTRGQLPVMLCAAKHNSQFEPGSSASLQSTLLSTYLFCIPPGSLLPSLVMFPFDRFW